VTADESEVTPLPQNDRRQRRKFTVEEKKRILKKAATCQGRGELAALLQREGLYNSHLTSWRKQFEHHGEAGLAAKRPGPAPTKDAKDRMIEQLEKRNARLEKELRISKALIDLQKKAHEILGIALPRVEDSTEDDSSSASNSAKKGSR
jgi:transposase-like protein